jgi:glutamyl-tRNA(Gln) amidotransferase subunit E
VSEYRTIDEMTLEDYQAIGLKSGLEIHQQLLTEKKLFCRCPVRPYSDHFDAEILRHMRPTLSELGEYDGTALMEFKTRKNIIYQINKETVCTYEMDDTPPFELNRQALDIALEITMLLGCKLVSEVHIARKQYLDGSIPTGFQRTTILGVDGSIPYGDRRIGIIQLGLEEDACREISDKAHDRIYRTDRLGIPLIETVTYPEMRTPQEVAEVAQIIRRLTRSTGKVRTGIGRTRQDVNVSVEGGRRVEIKGVPRIRQIPLLVHNEAFRQVALLGIMRELASRGITDKTFRYESREITEQLRSTQYYPVARAIREGLEVHAVVLRGYRGILSRKTQPETTFAREISDRVRVIACLDVLPNIAHSDSEGETFSSAEWSKIKKHSGTGDKDVVVVVWGEPDDVRTAVKEIAIRAREALDGVPHETRQALRDGTNGFERILPGPNRMYPDTDLPPIAITEERIERVRAGLAEPPWERRARYEKLGLNPVTAQRMSISPRRDLFDRAVEGSSYDPADLAVFLLERLPRLVRRSELPGWSEERFVETAAAASRGGIPAAAIEVLVTRTCGPEGADPASAVAAWTVPKAAELEKRMTKFLRSLEQPPLDGAGLHRYLTGRLVEEFRGYVSGRDASRFVEKDLAADAPGKGR